MATDSVYRKQALEELKKNSSFDVNGTYDSMLGAMNGAANANFNNTQQQIYGQQAGINQNYDAMNKQAYSNARLSALGNNEALAAQGLAGNAYAAPQSGYSETSRVAQNAALGNSINANNLARRNALDQLTGQINTARLSNDAALLGNQANVYGQKASAEQNQAQFDANMGLQKAQLYNQMGQEDFNNAISEAGVTGLYNDQKTLDAKNLDAQYTGMWNGQKTSTQKQQEIANAEAMLQLMGKATPEIAAILGIPPKTTTLEYQQMLKARDRGGGLKKPKAPTVPRPEEIAKQYNSVLSSSTYIDPSAKTGLQKAIDDAAAAWDEYDRKIKKYRRAGGK